VFDLSGVLAGDFTIKFSVTTTAKTISTLAHQRSSCDASKDFWDAQLSSAGTIKVYVLSAADGGRYAELTTSLVVNDGRTHVVELKRLAGTLESYIDGVRSGSVQAPQRLEALPTLKVGSGNPCEGAGGVRPLSGAVADVCLSR